MEKESALWYFECVDLYDILCPHKVESVAETHAVHRYRKDEYIYFPNEPANHIYMIAEGRVRIGHYLDNGKEVVIAILNAGEVFGELALAGEERRRDFAQSMDKSTMICPLSIDDLRSMMIDNHELSLSLLKLVGLRLLRLERKLDLLMFKDARTRIVEFIKDLASRKGRKIGYETLIPTRLTHQDIAALTGTSRQTVTCVLNDMRANNLINFDRKRILVRDLSHFR
jgi:CRP-like cAMP-binding protein